MKARIEPSSEPVYGNSSFEKVTKAPPTAYKLPLTASSSSNKRLDNSHKSEYDNNVNKHHNNNFYQQQSNGYSSRGVNQRATSPINNRNRPRSIHSDDYQGVTRDPLQPPLHFDTQEVLEETPAILRSLSSTGTRGPDTFVYLSSSKQSQLLSENEEDPCKTFIISSDSEDFVNKKNSLNQFTSNGYGHKINLATDSDNNEYLSYVIEKSDGDKEEKMSGEKNRNEEINRKGSPEEQGEEKVKENGDETDGVINKSAIKCHNKIESDNNNPDKNDDFHQKDDICEFEDGRGQQNDSGVLSFDRTITGKKEQAFAKLQEELEKAHMELKLKDEEVTRLTRIREDVERELEELTASLFQEAHRMVSKAKEKQAAAEKSLTESQMKMDVLSAEVVALKTLVLTSTPSRPNPHLHPQIGKEESGGNAAGSSTGGGVNLFNRKHRRSPSHFNLKYGRENSPPDSPVRDNNPVQSSVPNPALENRDISEVDPTIHKEFLNWSLNCKLDKTDPFIDRIYREDINLCLDFSNRELAEEVQKAIETRNIFIESVTDKSKTIFPRKCALLEVTRQCHYRMKLGDQDTWYNISQMCRNRIIAVCDFINYLRYIELGLVKSSAHEMYWEIMRLRKEMILARLGLSLPSS